MNDEPLPDPRRVTRVRAHQLVAVILMISWVGAFLAGHSAGFDAYEASEKATAVAIAGLAGISVYLLIRIPTDMNDFTMVLTVIPMVGLQRIGPKVVPESFSDVLVCTLLVNLMIAVVMGLLTPFLPRHDAAKSLTPPRLGNRRRELEVRPVKSSVVRSYLEAGLTERGREETP